MFKVSPASLQTFIDTPNSVLENRVQFSTFHIPNVFYDGHLQIISFLYCNLFFQSDRAKDLSAPLNNKSTQHSTAVAFSANLIYQYWLNCVFRCEIFATVFCPCL